MTENNLDIQTKTTWRTDFDAERVRHQVTLNKAAYSQATIKDVKENENK